MMTTALNPYLTFSGSCREAMTFYQQCLGGDLEMIVIGESPMASQFPADQQHHLIHSALTSGNIMLMASDMGTQVQAQPGNVISLSLSCQTRSEIESYFNKLSESGTIVRPLHDFFNGTVGVVTDKFGINWMFYCEPQQS